MHHLNVEYCLVFDISFYTVYESSVGENWVLFLFKCLTNQRYEYM